MGKIKFSDYINAWRVMEILRLINEIGDRMTLEQRDKIQKALRELFHVKHI